MPALPPNVAHFDANQVPTAMGVEGTLGTSDTGGTALPLPFAVDALSGAAFTKQINGTITSLPDPLGSVVVTVGTVTNTGTNVNIVSGSLVGTLLGGTLQAGTVNASIVSSNGTITRIQNVGTVESGTLQRNSLPVSLGTSYGTLGTAGAATWGTLVAAVGAGTRFYLTGLSIVVASGTVDTAITNGTFAGPNGNDVYTRGQFTPGGGIVRDFDPALRSGTNGTLTFWLGGAGTAFFTVQYFVT